MLAPTSLLECGRTVLPAKPSTCGLEDEPRHRPGSGRRLPRAGHRALRRLGVAVGGPRRADMGTASEIVTSLRGAVSK